MNEQAARFRDVFSVREFRVLWIAQTQSRIGDQFARVALALLVFDGTSSAALTALVYASTYLPPLLTAPLLAGLADRYSRRTVMWTVEVLRAGLIGLMAIPAVPLPLLAVLVVAASCPDPLFSAARVATLPRVLPDGRYQVGMSISSSTDGIAQIVGFALGGVVVAATGSPHLVLAIDALTFLASAALLRLGLRPHLPETDGTSTAARGFALAGIKLVAGDRRLMGLAALVWTFGLFVVPEAVAAPYAAEIGAGEAAVGLLMAADVVGMVIGALLVARLGADLRRRLTVPLAFAAGLPLSATLLAPPLPVTVLLWALSGLASSYLVLAQVRFVQLVPDGMRARAVGFAAAGLQTAQGLGMATAGVLAEALAPSTAIAVCGAAGSLGAVVVALAFGLIGTGATRTDPTPAEDRPEPSRT
ncbi:Predicted arabinose efflux permease, MFS family [Glycomyces sambucus]|uniref:Predicted arabinose efflux permease, MFS family n=1 Tax=Glycomyces sambucus TaxID=380244 RepID=A0A1G9FQN0_9ACTN|nr:MFS transporter [Glycomyces sambucus]SDK90704.1 Predicted arabinose efflux permease, MFS family [Glycomyces sambucus]